MRFELKISDWRKWLIISVAAVAGAILQDVIYPPGRLHIATRIGRLLGATIPAFALGGVFAIPVKGKAGAIVGVTVVVIVWGLVILGQSLS